MITDLRQRIVIFTLVLLLSVVFLLPTVARDSFTNWISKPIALGLDLSGGVHLLYQVESDEAVKNQLQSRASGIRNELRGEKVAVSKARAAAGNRVEFILLSELFVEKTKDFIAKEHRDLSFIESGTEDGKVKLVYGITEEQARRIKVDSVGHAIELLRSRVDRFGVSEPLIQKVGAERIQLQMPGVSDIVAVKKVVGSIGKLEFRLVPENKVPGAFITLKQREGGTLDVEDEIAMSGDAVAKAGVGFEDRGVSVNLSLTTDGARIFRKLTGENIGRRLAIVLDNVVYSAPVIQSAIPGGEAIISGQFTPQEARQLAVVLREALPAPLTILEERTVGPSLGQESVKSGLVAIAVGFTMIFLFMLVYYKKSGMVAAGSLALNLIFLMAALSAFGATLTLPGLAGLALTIGMAVDSNVIIFERIKEEIVNGSSRDAAVTKGFEKALTAILDSNMTTLLAAALLYYFGSGAIRGFAVTLAIGIVTTVFCATFCARLAFDALPLRGAKGLSI